MSGDELIEVDDACKRFGCRVDFNIAHTLTHCTHAMFTIYQEIDIQFRRRLQVSKKHANSQHIHSTTYNNTYNLLGNENSNIYGYSVFNILHVIILQNNNKNDSNKQFVLRWLEKKRKRAHTHVLCLYIVLKPLMHRDRSTMVYCYLSSEPDVECKHRNQYREREETGGERAK